MSEKVYISSKLLQSDSENNSPINPIFRARKKNQMKQKMHPQPPPPSPSSSRSSSRIPTPTPTPQPMKRKRHSFCSRFFSTVIPILIIGILIYFLCHYILNYMSRVVYCSDDIRLRKCVECPEHGTCLGGELKCDDGYIKSGNLCIIDEKHHLEVSKLYLKIIAYIASDINEYCNESNPVYQETIFEKFGKSEYYKSAMKMVKTSGRGSEYEIEHNHGIYISFNPILNTKCKAKKFVEENMTTLILIGVLILLLLVLIVSVIMKSRENSEVKRYAQAIVRQLLSDRKGKFRYATDFELTETNSLSKRWNEIVHEVERNPLVITLNGLKGKKWGIEH
ncbi:hypothetical protein TRFO_37362 [Tritrichomonas foetus]|uniref:Man1/Src1 C-terminal domain-containing protein n=1 Tax=Tritrichomonas foetus TaxID=1144522 RepID=A0A1J4JBB0_9EUKA|nr:hypothetical protein TRFO_37362 [Tritrichomonas foetus]|eukprot:OHS96470.1 hypothetical protein TRFO_37362 [Tritrichomonas foetus]